MKYSDWSIVFKKMELLLSSLSNDDIRRTLFITKTQSLKSVNDTTYTYSCSFTTTPEKSNNVLFGNQLTPAGIAQHQHASVGQTITSKIGAQLASTHSFANLHETGSVEISFDTRGIRTIVVNNNNHSLIASSTSSFNNNEWRIYCNEAGFFVNDDFYKHEDTDMMFNSDIVDDTKICLMELSENIINLSKITKEWVNE